MEHGPDNKRALLSKEEIRATAELARLQVSDSDLSRIAAELSAILAYAEQLSEIDVSGVAPMTHAVALDCPLRADVVGPHDSTAEALRNAPASESSLFAVPAVFAAARAEKDDHAGEG